MVLDPLCAAAPALLADGGSLLVVHSEFSGVDQSLAALRTGGLNAEVIAEQWIPFGPVLTARAAFLERLGMLDPGRRVEQRSEEHTTELQSRENLVCHGLCE